jgi:hypothetical protein
VTASFPPSRAPHVQRLGDGAQLLGQHERAGQVGAGQCNREFLAAETANTSKHAGANERFGKAAQHFVAELMAVRIVDELEVVQVISTSDTPWPSRWARPQAFCSISSKCRG